MRDGSFVMEGYVPEIDATGVTKVLEAGMVNKIHLPTFIVCTIELMKSLFFLLH